MRNASLMFFRTQEKCSHCFHLKIMLTIIAVIYRGDCSCNQYYTGETDRNAKVKLNEHEDKKTATLNQLSI